VVVEVEASVVGGAVVDEEPTGGEVVNEVLKTEPPAEAQADSVRASRAFFIG
jgi:hypothetical protein